MMATRGEVIGRPFLLVCVNFSPSRAIEKPCAVVFSEGQFRKRGAAQGGIASGPALVMQVGSTQTTIHVEQVNPYGLFSQSD